MVSHAGARPVQGALDEGEDVEVEEFVEPAVVHAARRYYQDHQVAPLLRAVAAATLWSEQPLRPRTFAGLSWAVVCSTPGRLRHWLRTSAAESDCHELRRLTGADLHALRARWPRHVGVVLDPLCLHVLALPRPTEIPAALAS